ncbi:MAG: cytochrome c oxidase accessory protein FixG [Myxococcota bacterium]|jgi:cytochrome c oxidase accessory protein FixG
MLQYFEKRKKTYPQDVKGKFRSIKNITNFICLAIFFLIPLIRWDRGPSISNQAILIDIPNARGYFFFIEMWPEEVYYIAALLIFSAIALFFVTSLFGRVWCGYSCPQTVWTDIFVKIERLFQGDRNERIKRDRKVFSFQNIWRKIATHFTWILISFITGLGFVNYFNDSISILTNIIDLNISWSQIGWISGIAGMTYLMAGFAREQVCNYMCPYARFQSAMFDPNTLIISYDALRGEKRAKAKKGDSFEDRGHCIDCKQCVVVCPANIDIRDGLQMECIACGLCIDACDNVMEKMNLPKGLIRYDTEIHLANNALSNLKAGSSYCKTTDCKSSEEKTRFKFLRPRTFYYLAILIVTGSLIILNLSSKLPLKVDVLPDRNPMFVMMSNGDIRNGYTIKISNKTFVDKFYQIEVAGINFSKMRIADLDNLHSKNVLVRAGEVENFKAYLTVEEKNISGRNDVQFIVTDDEGSSVAAKSVFIGR